MGSAIEEKEARKKLKKGKKPTKMEALTTGEEEEEAREEMDEEVKDKEEGNDGNSKEEDKEEKKKKRNKEKLRKEAEKAAGRGVCYLSRIPPHMDHVKLRHIFSRHADILRIYLAPEDPETRVYRKKAGGFRGQGFSEGWVEFADKREAKGVVNMLNGEQIGGRKRSQFYYDIWNIKYLSKFKWDDLTQETAYKSAVREQKLKLELSAAKRERDFYLSMVDKSCALSSIEERLKKKQKVQGESTTESSVVEHIPKVIRHFPQKKPVAGKADRSKQLLSNDILAGVFGGT